MSTIHRSKLDRDAHSRHIPCQYLVGALGLLAVLSALNICICICICMLGPDVWGLSMPCGVQSGTVRSLFAPLLRGRFVLQVPRSCGPSASTTERAGEKTRLLGRPCPTVSPEHLRRRPVGTMILSGMQSSCFVIPDLKVQGWNGSRVMEGRHRWQGQPDTFTYRRPDHRHDADRRDQI